MPCAGAIATLLLALLSGCARFPEPAMPNAAPPPCSASAAAEIEARTADFLQQMFGPVDPRPAGITLYPDAATLRQTLGFAPTDRASGYYDRAADRIHASCSDTQGAGFAAILQHEATHRYLYRRFPFHPPQNGRFSAGYPLPVVPPWLHEGLAACMESGQISAGKFELRLNTQRLSEFRRLLWRGRLPPLRRVLSKGFDDPFGSSDYAVAWASVHYLLQDSRTQKSLIDYLDAARQGLFDDPEQEYPALVADCNDFPEFTRAWDRHISAASVRLFRQRLLLPDQSPADWEQRWRRAIWQEGSQNAAP